MKKVLIICLLFFVSKAFCQTAEPLVYTNGKVKIELKFEDESKALKKGKKNRIIINTQNLDTRMMTCSAPGLRYVRNLNPENTITVWEINLEDWQSDKPYSLFFSYKGKKTQFSGKFEIPVE